MLGYLCACAGMSSKCKYICHCINYIAVMTQPSWSPILSPVLFMQVDDPYILPFLKFISPPSHSDSIYFIILTHFVFPFSTIISPWQYSITMRFFTKNYYAMFHSCTCMYCYILSFNNVMAVFYYVCIPTF